MHKVAILTAFNEFQPGFSLTGIVKDQCRMLLEWGHEVHLFVQEHYNDKFDADMPKGVILHKTVPTFHQKDYKKLSEIMPEHDAIATRFAETLVDELKDFQVAFVHDFILQGWYMPFGLAVQRATLRLPEVRWFHWLHSIAHRRDDWWKMSMLGSRHKLIYPNKTDSVRIAEAYFSDPSSIRIIPHIKDLRSWFDFDGVTCDIIKDFPSLMQADVVQVYPASADRLSSKNVDKVIRIMGSIKNLGFSTALFIADQWATMKQHREEAQKYIDLGREVGLTERDLMFSSSWRNNEYGIGLPKRILRELMLCSNLFVFPTTHETFGLVGPEAALCGAFVVTNRSLYMQGEIWDHEPLSFDFGSFHNNFAPADNDWRPYCHAMANVIIARMRENENTMTRTIARQKFNWDHLYNQCYRPYMEESRKW